MSKINTKEKILSTALYLFNEKGLSNVTLRTIASEMNISQGNLNYHFKKRDEIIEGLYFQLVDRINNSINSQLDNISLNSLFHVYQSIINNFDEYRFFLLDFVQITRNNRTIQLHYKQLNEERQLQLEFFFNEMIKNDTMKKRKFEGEYEMLFKRLQILTDFWLSNASIYYNDISIEIKNQYLKVILYELYPYLTKKGKAEFQKLIKG